MTEREMNIMEQMQRMQEGKRRTRLVEVRYSQIHRGVAGLGETDTNINGGKAAIRNRITVLEQDSGEFSNKVNKKTGKAVRSRAKQWPEIKALEDHMKKIKDFVNSIALQGRFSVRGLKVIPVEDMPRLQEGIEEMRREIRPLVEALLLPDPDKPSRTIYDKYVEWDRFRFSVTEDRYVLIRDAYGEPELGYDGQPLFVRDAYGDKVVEKVVVPNAQNQFNPRAYPPRDELINKYNVVAIPIVRELDESSFTSLESKEMAYKLEVMMWADFCDEVQYNLRLEFSRWMEGFVEQMLNPNPIKFDPRSLDTFNTFVDGLRRNMAVTQDEDLTAIINNVRRTLGTSLADPDSLKVRRNEVPYARLELGEKLQPMKELISSMVTDRPKRRISLDEEEE